MEQYYRILDVDRNASPDEIKQAYYDLIVIWRADKYLHDPRLHEKAINKLKEIDEAYQKILEYLKPQRQLQEKTKPSESAKQQAIRETLDIPYAEHPISGSKKAAADTRYKGVGGWLLFLCVQLTILQPLFGTLSTLGEYSKTVKDIPSLKGVALIFVFISLGLIAFGFYAGVSLWRVRLGAVNLTKKYLIVEFSTLSAIVLFAVAGGENIASAIGMLIALGIYLAIWYSYLNKSKRVKATYQDAVISMNVQPSSVETKQKLESNIQRARSATKEQIDELKRIAGNDVVTFAYMTDTEWFCVCGARNSLNVSKDIQNCFLCHRNRDFGYCQLSCVNCL